MYICILGTLIAAPYNTRFCFVSLHLIYPTCFLSTLVLVDAIHARQAITMYESQVCAYGHQAPARHLWPSDSVCASARRWIRASPTCTYHNLCPHDVSIGSPRASRIKAEHLCASHNAPFSADMASVPSLEEKLQAIANRIVPSDICAWTFGALFREKDGSGMRQAWASAGEIPAGRPEGTMVSVVLSGEVLLLINGHRRRW